MLKYRAASSKLTDGHGTNFFSMHARTTMQWARAEFKAGFDVEVFEVREFSLKKAAHPEKCRSGHAVKPTDLKCEECGAILCQEF